MDAAAQSLAELGELSSQVDHAVVLDAEGSPVATFPADAGGEVLARAALEAVEVAGGIHSGAEVSAVEVELEGGALFVVRSGGRTVAAVTGPGPAAGLVLYDLRTCLRRIEEAEAAKPKRRRHPRKAEEGP
jgi:predicted regulator of Ras-like GTPase activity (Roadblock/LC7/MglB family)